MSHRVTNLVKSRSFGSSAAKTIMVLMADAGDDAGVNYLSQARVAREAEISERTVRRVLADLSKRGVIVRRHRRDESGSRTSDRTVLVLAAIESLPAIDDRQPAIERVPTGQALAGETSVLTSVPTRGRRKKESGQRPLPLYVQGVTTTAEGIHSPGAGFIPYFVSERDRMVE